MIAICAIVGRPNVGKSTLFNRLIGSRRAIESDVPGTTRDRIHYKLKLNDRELTLVDTGGIELNTGEGTIESQVQEQSKVAIMGADLILWVVDVKHDLTSEDYHALELLRKSKKPVILIANKTDNLQLKDAAVHLYSLGISNVLFLSALHAHGLYELEDELYEFLKEHDLGLVEERDASAPIRLALVGRPNVGKSTMLNSLARKEIVVTSDIPGTTRDRIDVEFEWKDRPMVLVDTAGIRRRGKIDVGLEKYSVLRTFRAISEADVCVLLMDIQEGVTAQDCHVSEFALNEGKGLILVANKVDVYEGEEREMEENRFISNTRRKMAYVPWAPLVFTSALRGKHVEPILDLTLSIYDERRHRVDQAELTAWLRSVLLQHPPRGQKGRKRFAVLQVEQVNVDPPHFVFVCEHPELMHFSYERFLENQLRAAFGFGGTSVWLTFRSVRDHTERQRRVKSRQKGVEVDEDI